MEKFLFNRFTVAATVFFVAMVGYTQSQAQSLLTLYEQAKKNDASYQSSLAQVRANEAKAEQAKSAILPVVGLSAGASRTRLDIDKPDTTRTYGQTNIGLNAVQPLYRPVNLATKRQGDKQLELAQEQLKLVQQELIIRVAQAYFDVLAAQDSLSVIDAQKVAITEQLAFAKRNFEVGSATITDTREAQARFDLNAAQAIAAKNDLQVKKLVLENMVGQIGIDPLPLIKTPVSIEHLALGDEKRWIDQAMHNHPSIKQAALAYEVAQLETEKAQGGHKPTLDLKGGYGITKFSGTASSDARYRADSANIGLEFSLPLFAGFSIQNRVKETLALEDKAQADLENAKRSVVQVVRTAYYGVQSGLSGIKAYEAALSSSQSALDANKLGYQVGIRINIDVLNSQSQLFQTQRDLSKARYDTLVAGLKLRYATGLLAPEDLLPINALIRQ